MPFVNIKITRDGVTPEKKAEVIRLVTKVLVDVLGGKKVRLARSICRLDLHVS